MKATFLKDYEEATIAYIPIGTFEWHGNHLPLESDLIIAENITDMVAEEIPGVVLPPIYIATDIKKDGLTGMEVSLGKTLPGSIFYSDPSLMKGVYQALVDYLDKFDRIFLITGHSGAKHLEVLQAVAKENQRVCLIQPSEGLNLGLKHAAEGETSLVWAIMPELERKSQNMNISKDDDYFKFRERDVRKDASMKEGRRLLQVMVENSIKKIRTSL